MPPEASEDPARTSPPQPSPARSGDGKAPSSLRGGKTNSGCAAPNPTNSRAEEDFISPPDFEDTGASNMGAGSEDVGRPEPLVPPVLEKKKKKKTTTTSPSKTMPATSSPAKDAPASPPAPPTKPAPAPIKLRRRER
jgi:hypothetical protein